MRLNCLGTVGYHPNAFRHTSCYLLPESGIVLDAGSGMFRLAPLIQTDSLDVLISHAHLDHTFGLTFLLDVLYERPVETLRIWGEQAKLDAIRTHLFADLLFPATLKAEWCAIDDCDHFQIGDAEVRWRPQEHPGGSVAYRIDWKKREKSLVYMTDTVGDTSRAAAVWAGQPDLLMHECYFRDSAEKWAKKTGHCWTSQLIRVAEGCQPKKLMITHINPLETSADPVDLEIIREALNCEVILAEDELSFDF